MILIAGDRRSLSDENDVVIKDGLREGMLGLWSPSLCNVSDGRMTLKM